MYPDLVAIAENPIPDGARVFFPTTADGLRLRAAIWPAAGQQARGTMVVIQGRNEFIEKYFETIADFRRRGFAVAAFDFRNQGGSERLLASGACHVEGFADYDRDLDAFLAVLPDLPRPHHAIAHSTGGLILLRALHDRRADFDRVVLLAPLLALSRFASPPMPVVRFVSGLNLLAGLDLRLLSPRTWQRWKDVDPADEWRNDRTRSVLAAEPRLGSGRPTYRWLHASALAMKEATRPDFAAAIGTPLLIVVAGRDNVVGNDIQQRYAALLPAGRRVVIDGGRHELLMEPDSIRNRVWTAIDAFLQGEAST